MLFPESARSALRSATAPHHERVDGLFSRTRLGERAGYGCFLTAQAAAFLPVEDALTTAGAASLLPDWHERRRGALLRADLAALGLSVPPPGAMPAFDDPAAILGGAYVLEGSRLGGRLLRRQVPAEFPASFLGGGTDPAAWQRMLALMEARLVGDESRLVAIGAAASVFELFEAAARRHLAA